MHFALLQNYGKRFVDKLLKVWLVDGEEAWLLLHIELQSQTDSGFPKRMFIYHYRIYDRYDREVVSLAVLGDEQPNWQPTEYSYGRWGSEMRLRKVLCKADKRFGKHLRRLQKEGEKGDGEESQ